MAIEVGIEEQTPSRASTGAGSELQEQGQAPPVDALHAHGRLRRPRGPRDRARRGLLRVRRARQALPRRPRRALLRQRRPRPQGARRGGEAPDGRARVLHHVELRASSGDRAGRAHRSARSRRPQPGVLHLRRIGGRRVGVEAGARVSPSERRGPAPQGDLAKPRLPRHHPRRARLHRPDVAADAVRAARSGRRARPQHEQLPLAGGPRPAVGRGRDRARRSSSRAPRRSPP